ncbi:MAG: hypothetical protein ACYSR5_02420 [Planctomycetota bacterium]|jgi:hypothetical protein
MVEDDKPKYRAVFSFGASIAVVGWVVAVLGAISVAYGIAVLMETPEGMVRLVVLSALALYFLVALMGLLLATVGNLIIVLADNSNNTGAMLALMRTGKSVSPLSGEPNK